MENSKFVLNTAKETAFDLVHIYTSTSGAKLYLCPMPNIRTATCLTHVLTGSIYEMQYLGCGLSHFLEHMMFHGSKNFPGRTEISDRVSACGGSLNACTSDTVTDYFMTTPAGFAGTALTMQIDMMRNPLFPEDEFKREHDVILRECDMYAGKPSHIIWETLQKNLFRWTPSQLPVIGMAHKLKTVTREMMMDYFRLSYTPDRIVFVVAGNFNEMELIDLFEKQTADWYQENYVPPLQYDQDPLFGRTDIELTHPDPISRLIFAWNSIDQIKARQIPPALANIMNSSMNPMVRKLLYDRAIALNVDVSCLPALHSDNIILSAHAKPENLEEIETCIFEEIDRLKSGKVTDEEIERIRAASRYETILSLTDSLSFARVVANQSELGNTDFKTFFMERDNIDPSSITEAAKKCFRDNCFIRIVMSAEKAKKAPPHTIEGQQTTAPNVSKLDCGATLVHMEDNSLPLVEVTLYLPGGKIYETREQASISQFLRYCIPTGCERYTEEEIQAILSNNAISMGGENGRNSLFFYFSCTKDKLPIALDLFCAVFEKPTFQPDKVEREREKCLDSIASIFQSHPETIVSNTVQKLIFPEGHPYGFNINDSIASLTRLTCEDLKEFYFKKIKNSSRAVLAIGGDLSAAEAKSAAEAIFSAGTWIQEEASFPEPPPMPAAFEQELRHPAAKQTFVDLAFRIPGFNGGDNGLFVNLLFSIENGMTSMLFKTIRGEHGLAYATFMRGKIGIGCGYGEIIAMTSEENAAKCLQLLRKEFTRLQNEGVSEEEFQNACTAEKFMIDSNSILSTLRLTGLNLFLGLGENYITEERERLNNVTLDEFNAWLRKNLSDTNTIAITQLPGGENGEEQESEEIIPQDPEEE